MPNGQESGKGTSEEDGTEHTTIDYRSEPKGKEDNDEVRRMRGIETAEEEVMRKQRLGWYGHVVRKEEESPI